MQRVKRFISVELTLYLPTPDKRFTAEIITPSSGFGKKLRYFRLKKGLTRDELSERSGVSKGYLATIEQNNRSLINPRYIQKIAKGLELNPLKLISYNGSAGKKKHFLDYVIPPETLGARIKNLRIKQGLNFKEFTKRLKVSKDSTWRFEKNITVPNEKMLKRIAKLLRVSVSELTRNLAKER
ncbi:MAG: helix-turn-helix domain-containing protein [Candidatus Omnitrophica bacterium]|nr:helix-turn-helix domain-containing protein [Candidatus Omnitrophota bacterium]